VREIIVPIDHISAIFARENGQGMAFPKVTHRLKDASENTSNVTTGMFGRTDANSNEPHQDKTHGDETTSAPPPPAGKRPALTRIK
jgi:stringent starvation protein B